MKYNTTTIDWTTVTTLDWPRAAWSPPCTPRSTTTAQWGSGYQRIINLRKLLFFISLHINVVALSLKIQSDRLSCMFHWHSEVLSLLSLHFSFSNCQKGRAGLFYPSMSCKDTSSVLFLCSRISLSCEIQLLLVTVQNYMLWQLNSFIPAQDCFTLLTSIF